MRTGDVGVRGGTQIKVRVLVAMCESGEEAEWLWKTKEMKNEKKDVEVAREMEAEYETEIYSPVEMSAWFSRKDALLSSVK